MTLRIQTDRRIEAFFDGFINGAGLQGVSNDDRLRFQAGLPRERSLTSIADRHNNGIERTKRHGTGRGFRVSEAPID